MELTEIKTSKKVSKELNSIVEKHIKKKENFNLKNLVLEIYQYGLTEGIETTKKSFYLKELSDNKDINSNIYKSILSRKNNKENNK